ncbi:MAG: hypothetical protein ACU84J_07250 [Gammaproteobacteria bacterium]
MKSSSKSTAIATAKFYCYLKTQRTARSGAFDINQLDHAVAVIADTVPLQSVHIGNMLTLLL